MCTSCFVRALEKGQHCVFLMLCANASSTGGLLAMCAVMCFGKAFSTPFPTLIQGNAPHLLMTERRSLQRGH